MHKIRNLANCCLIVFLLACLLPSPSPGDVEITGPAIFFVFPAGGQRGKTVEVAMGGQQLKGATGVYVSGKGLTASLLPEAKPDPAAKQNPGGPKKPPKPWISTNNRSTDLVAFRSPSPRTRNRGSTTSG